MTTPVRLFAVAAILAAAVVPVAAQDAIPQVSIVQAGADALKSDLRFMMGLTSEDEQKQLPIVLDYLSEFQLGIDGSRPIRFDLLIENNSVRSRPSFPVSDIDDFLTNLDAFGINVRKRGSDLFNLTNAFEGGMRYSRRSQYVWISEDQKDIPRSFQPQEGPTDLLKDGHDLAAQILNSSDQKDVESRRSSFTKLREELMAAIKPMEDEEAEDFDLRKKLTEHQINEIERYFVEAQEVVIGWTTDEEKKEGRGLLHLEAVPETELAASLALLGAKPSDFANIPESESAILSGRINHPLDAMRIKQLTETFELLQARADSKIDGYDLTDEQKAASKVVAQKLYAMLIEGAKAGVLDAFVEVSRNDQGLHTVVGGFKSPAASMLVEVAPQFATAGAVEKVEPAIETVAGVSIHRFTANSDEGDFASIFGDDRSIYVGTSDSAVWYAVGINSLDALKQAIAQKGSEPKAEGQERFLSLKVILGPWLEMLDKLEPPQDLSDERGKFRKMALAAFEPGDSLLTAELKRDGEKIVGNMVIQPGVLRLVGKLVADFSAENLQ